jgi:hypothetical protein
MTVSYKCLDTVVTNFTEVDTFLEGLAYPATLREPVGGELILDVVDGAMLFRGHPFPSAGRVVRARLRAEKTSGTLHLGIYRRTAGTTEHCGEYERLRMAEIPRTATGMVDVRASQSQFQYHYLTTGR